MPTDQLIVAAPLFGAAVALTAVWMLSRFKLRPGKAQTPEEEIAALVEAGDFEGAANRLSALGEPGQALELYEQAGNRSKVAHCHLAMKQPGQAAQVYRDLGRHAEAAHYFQAAGEWVAAAEALVILDCEREAAELYERAGELQRAAQLMLRLDDLENAARLFERAGMGSEAAEALINARGRRPKVLKRAAELYESAGDLESAADCLAGAKEHRRAAELYEGLGRHARAAQEYEQDSVWERAAACYEQAGALAQARANYDRAGDRVRSAAVAQEEGNFLEAGQAFYEVGAYERAIEALQRILDQSEQAHPGARVQARIFVEKGLLDRARERIHWLGRDEPHCKDDLEVMLMLANAYERIADAPAALEIFERISAVDAEYGDVALRMERLQDRAWCGSSTTLSDGAAERYELRNEIGRGGMGVVYLAWDKDLERTVAIKFLPDELASNEEAVKMFRGEARAAAAMNHPNIVHIYDVAIVDGKPCIVMEYVQGRTVRQIMRVQGTNKKKPLPAARVAEAARDISEALAYAHTSNVIHRDVKPANMLIAPNGTVKLMDFGISKVLEAGVEGLTKAKGTPQYMPPEQILGREIDARTDLYALGISMFEMATGRRPFGGEDVVDKQLHASLPDPRDQVPDLPEALVEIIQKATEKAPSDRFNSATQMAAALSAFLERD
ncbi:MAG: protein kinase [bacterium]|nr:protein kinase [bacterium]